jgi:hypothetical protein
MSSLEPPQIQMPQSGQIQRLPILPLPRTRWTKRGEPVTVKAGAGTITPMPNAEPDKDWQSVQWHAYTASGGCVIV